MRVTTIKGIKFKIENKKRDTNNLENIGKYDWLQRYL